ncbi:MAG: hypothetical protein NUV59_03470 [Patescibacteria group bacterium]|nr:hypothetical protein [Patescibacteria group bacterium]
MLLRIAWAFFAAEVLLAIVFALIFWYFWSHSAMSRGVVYKALAVYILGCLVVLLIAMTVPL